MKLASIHEKFRVHLALLVEVTRNLALAFPRRKKERLVLLLTKGKPWSIIKIKLHILRHWLFVLISMLLEHMLQFQLNNLGWSGISQSMINGRAYRENHMFNKHNMHLFN